MTLPPKLSGQQKVDANASAFVSWIATKADALFRNIVVRMELSRQEVAKEIAFAKNVLLQNPHVRAALAELEANLGASGVLPPVAEANGASP